MPDRYRTTHRWLAAGLCALAIGVTTRVSHADVNVALSPTTISIAPNSDFEVFVDVSSAGSAFNAFRLVVGFDPAALTSVPLVPTSTQEGCLVTGACSAACGQTFRDFAATRDSVVAVEVLLCDLVSITGPGHLYRLRFHSSGTAQAALLHVRRLVFYNAGETVEPVHITDAQVLIGVIHNKGGADRTTRTNPSRWRWSPQPPWAGSSVVSHVLRAPHLQRPRRCAPTAAYLMNSTTETASRVPITTLNVRRACSERSARWTTAPKASQTKQHGSAASTKISASIAACRCTLPPLWSRNVAAALVQTNHDFGLIH